MPKKNNPVSTPVNTTDWTPELVRQHCASAARLEMWTIPLYLCVAYSIKNVAKDKNGLPTFAPVNYPVDHNHEPVYDWFKGKPKQAAQFAFNVILSVAIQEMLHCELAANLCNAVSGTVDFTGPDGSLAPVYDPDHVPCVEVPRNKRSLVKLGPLSNDSIDLMIWIEHWLPKTITPPLSTKPQDKYRSIGEFYYALQHGIDAQWENLYPQTGSPSATKLKQKDDFQKRLNKLMELVKIHLQLRQDYKFSVMIYGPSATAEKSADTAVEAITEQGEGAPAGDHKSINPDFQPVSGSGPAVEIALDEWTHWDRFGQVKKVMAVQPIATYSTDKPSPGLPSLQNVMRNSYSSFLDLLNAGFGSSKPLSLVSMAGVGSRFAEVWENGGIPNISYEVYAPPQYPHACQGLNACAGQGVGGSGTAAGDGDCATAWAHTCGSGNKCKSQGGCGYAAFANVPDDFTKNWLPSQNAAAGKDGNGGGGCGAPIPPGQGFNSTDTTAPFAPEQFPDKTQCRGANVWDRARKELEVAWTKQGKTIKPAPPVNPLRKSLKPTVT